MTWDEIDAVGPAKAKATTLTRTRYFWLLFQVTAGFWVVLFVGHMTITFRSPFQWLSNFFGWAGVIFARLTVDAWLKYRGLSLAGPTVQVWGKAGAAPTGRAVVGDDAVEIQTPRAGLLIFSVVCLVVCLPTFALAPWLVSQASQAHGVTDWPSRLGLLVAVALAAGGVGALGCWLLARAVIPQRLYRADAAGFHRFRDRKFLPWADIATCRVTTQHNPLGDPTTTTHELIDWRGETLLKLNLAFLPTPDRDRLVNFIHARLPKPVGDQAWDGF